MDRIAVNRTNGVQHIDFLIADLIGIEGDHRFHGDQTEQLHQMILHHVAQGARMVVIAAPVLHPHLLRPR